MTQGPLGPGTMADDATVGLAVWVNPDNAKVSDNIYTTYVTADADGTTPSHYLKATNFGFSIPSRATINGILVEVESKVSFGVQTFGNVRIVKGGNISTTTISGGTSAIITTEGYQSIPVSDASTYLWGESLLYSDINATNFGVVIQGNGGATPRTVSVDYIRMTVYYTVPPRRNFPLWI